MFRAATAVGRRSAAVSPAAAAAARRDAVLPVEEEQASESVPGAGPAGAFSPSMLCSSHTCVSELLGQVSVFIFLWFECSFILFSNILMKKGGGRLQVLFFIFSAENRKREPPPHLCRCVLEIIYSMHIITVCFYFTTIDAEECFNCLISSNVSLFRGLGEAGVLQHTVCHHCHAF